MSTVINGVNIEGSVFRANRYFEIKSGKFTSKSDMPTKLDVGDTPLQGFKFLILFGEYVYQRDNGNQHLFWLLMKPDTDAAFLAEIGATRGRYVRRPDEEKALNKAIEVANSKVEQGSGLEMMDTLTNDEFFVLTDQWSIPQSALLARNYMSGEFIVNGVTYSPAIHNQIHPVKLEIAGKEYVVYLRKK